MAAETRNLNDSLVKVSVLKTLYNEIVTSIQQVSNSIKNSTITLVRKQGSTKTTVGSFNLNQSTNQELDINPTSSDIAYALGYTPADKSVTVFESSKDVQMINLQGATVKDLDEAVAQTANTKLEIDLTNANSL